jgi:tRNA 2-selenouridine synthase
VLDDEERILVGTTYKQVGSFEAKKHRRARWWPRNIARHIDTLFADKPRDWKPLVYCWRGGNRSGSMAHILAKIGWPVVQLDGGYKAYRSHVSGALDSRRRWNCAWCAAPPAAARAACWKRWRRIGAQVLDLERLAAHRGSVLGHLPGEPQPEPEDVRDRIWDTLRRFDPARPVFVESESKKVGNLRVPDAVMERMRAAPCIALSCRARTGCAADGGLRTLRRRSGGPERAAGTPGAAARARQDRRLARAGQRAADAGAGRPAAGRALRSGLPAFDRPEFRAVSAGAGAWS